MKLKVGKYYSIGHTLALRLTSIGKQKIQFRVLYKPQGSALITGGLMQLDTTLFNYIQSHFKEIPKLKAKLLYES